MPPLLRSTVKGCGRIAVPVLGSDGIIGGISVVVASDLVPTARLIKECSPQMTRTSHEISEALGHLAKNRLHPD